MAHDDHVNMTMIIISNVVNALVNISIFLLKHITVIVIIFELLIS